MNLRNKGANNEDRVVATYNIYASPKLSSDMHVFLYPLRGKNRPYEADSTKLYCTDGLNSEKVSSEECKTIHSGSRLTMQLEVDIFGSKSFDKKYFSENNSLHTYTLQSKPFQPKSNYVVVYIDKNGFHFSPVCSVQQFTPLLTDTSYCESSPTSPLRTEDSFPTNQAIDGYNSDKYQRENAWQRSVMFSKDASTKKELQVYALGSLESLSVRSRLASPTCEMIDQNLPRMSQEQIRNCFFPPNVFKSKGEQLTVVRRFASHFSLEERVRDLMNRCHILPMEIILDRVSCSTESVTEKDVLSSLFNFCFFMHGVWVTYESSLFQGVSDALRGVILSFFFSSSDGTVRRSELNELVNSSSLRKIIKEILETIALLNTSSQPSQRFWKLRYGADETKTQQESQRIFSMHPQKAAAQEAMLTQAFGRREQYLYFINMGKSGSIFSMMPGANSSPREGELKVASSPTQLLPSDQKIVDDISRHLRTILLKDGVINKETLKAKVLEDRKMKYPTATLYQMRIAMQSVVREFTNNTWILKTLDDSTIDRFRPTILSTILALQTFSFSQLIETLSKQISDTIPEDIVKRVVSEVAHYSKGDRLYSLKNGLEN